MILVVACAADAAPPPPSGPAALDAEPLTGSALPQSLTA